MKQIFEVTSGEYDSYGVDGRFTNKEIADKVAEMLRKNPRWSINKDSISVNEVDVYETIEEYMADNPQ